MASSQKIDAPSLDVEPKSKKLKNDQSENVNENCPLFRLPDDILAKIIGYVPVTQWTDLELVCTNFRDITYLAWRSLRHVNLDNDFKYIPTSDYLDIWPKKYMSSMEWVLEKLIERAPFIRSLKGVRFQMHDPNLNAAALGVLLKFENLESISFTRQIVPLPDRPTRHRGMVLFDYNGNFTVAIPTGEFITFIESTRSRSTLKEIIVEPFIIDNSAELLDSFALRVQQTNLVDNTEGRKQRMRLDKLHISPWSYSCFEPPAPSWSGIIDLVDTSTLTSLSLGASLVEPESLLNMVESAPNLHHLGFALACCKVDEFKRHRMEVCKRLMDIIATHQTVDELHIFEWRPAFEAQGGCWQFEAEFMRMLKSIGPRLRVFGLEAYRPWFDIEQIAEIICTYMPDLKSIHLRVDEMSTVNIKRIVGLQNLEEISLELGPPCIDDDIIATIGQSTCLTNLRLCECYNDDVSPTFAGLANLATLSKLEMKDAGNISSDVFASWGVGFGSTLEELRLSDADEDAYPGLIDLIKKANRLRILHLEETALTNGILDALAASCPNLECIGKLNISENNVLAVQRIIDACPKVKVLRVEYSEAGHDSRGQLAIDKYRNICIH